jgi:hypothetical protein
VGIHNPREHQHVDSSGFGTQQCPRAGIDGGPGSQDIVDQDHAAALDFGLPVGGRFECALHIAGALRPRQPDLLLDRPDAPQHVSSHLDAALAFDDSRQRAGLIVNAGATPAANAAEPE